MGKWLPLAEFSYNNSYQASIKMASFEGLYGRKCRTPLNWVELGERRYYGIDFVKEAEEQVSIIQQLIKAALMRTSPARIQPHWQLLIHR